MAEVVRLVHDNGCAVTVDAGKVDALLSRGFTIPAAKSEPAPKRRAPARKKQ